MAKSKWHTLTEEQKAKARETAKAGRARRRQTVLLTEERKQQLSEQRKAARARRIARDPVHHQAVQSSYKRNAGWYASWLNSIRDRAKKKNVPCDLTVQDLKDMLPTYCPILGIPLIRRADRWDNQPGSPQVDRIIPELGYVKGNVQIISRRANGIKSDASLDEIKLVVEYLERMYNKTSI